HHSQQEALAEMRLLEADGHRQRVIPSRQYRKRERAHGQRDRVENSDQRATEESRHQQREEEVVFEGLPLFVSVGIDALTAGLFPQPYVTSHVVQRPERAYPATEESSQQQRWKEDR